MNENFMKEIENALVDTKEEREFAHSIITLLHDMKCPNWADWFTNEWIKDKNQGIEIATTILEAFGIFNYQSLMIRIHCLSNDEYFIENNTVITGKKTVQLNPMMV